MKKRLKSTLLVLGKILPDSLYLRIFYYLNFKRKLNLKNPKTFNEKIQWLKLFDRKKKYQDLADKYNVREYIKNIIGEEYLIPLYGVWNNVKDIDWDNLPDKFVIKCTHDGGGESVNICINKSTFDIDSVKIKLQNSFRKNAFWYGREWPYKKMKPQVIAEQLLEDNENADLIDYKFMVCDNVVKCVVVCSNRKNKPNMNVTIFDNTWNKMPYEYSGIPSSLSSIPKPINFDRMLMLAEKISLDINIPFIRIDFYEVNKKIYFGEITLYPASGLLKFNSTVFDEWLGKFITLNHE